MLKERVSTSATDTKGPIVHQGRLSELAGDRNGYLAHLDKMWGANDKSRYVMSLEENRLHQQDCIEVCGLKKHLMHSKQKFVCLTIYSNFVACQSSCLTHRSTSQMRRGENSSQHAVPVAKELYKQIEKERQREMKSLIKYFFKKRTKILQWHQKPT